MTNQIIVSKTTGKPIIDNVSNEDDESNRQENGLEDNVYVDKRTTKLSNEDDGSNIEENGLEDDLYDADVIVTSLSPEQREEKKRNYVVQKPETTTFKEGNSITNKNWEELKENVNQDNNSEENLPKQTREQFGVAAWMHVQMPQEFGYTGAILANNTYQGLLHTFFRHSNQWLEYIPDLRNLMNNLPDSIHDLMRNVQEAGNRESSREAINKLNEELKKLLNKSSIYVSITNE